MYWGKNKELLPFYDLSPRQNINDSNMVPVLRALRIRDMGLPGTFVAVYVSTFWLMRLSNVPSEQHKLLQARWVMRYRPGCWGTKKRQVNAANSELDPEPLEAQTYPRKQKGVEGRIYL